MTPATIPMMHMIGSAILFGMASGPKGILAAPILGLFGWFFIFPETLGLGAIFALYQPRENQGIKRTSTLCLAWALVGGVLVAPFIPKEENNELLFWITGFLAGAGTAAFAFLSVHFIKKPEPVGVGNVATRRA